MLSNLWKTSTIGAGILLVLTLGWALRLDSLRGGWQDKYNALDGQAQTVTIATQQATGNPGLVWSGVPAQITALASSNQSLKSAIGTANGKVADLDAETKRLKLAGDTLRSELSTAQAARSVLQGKLAGMAQMPGDRQNCPALLSQTQDALDLAWGSGL